MSVRSTGCKLAAVRAALLAAALLLSPAAAAAGGELAAIPQGLSGEDALWRECPLGDYAADAVRQGSGAEIALIPAGLLGADLVGDGSVTEEEAAAVIGENCAVIVYELTAPQLKILLEDGVSHLALNQRETLDADASSYNGFLQLSGLTVTADATAPPGERILTVTVGGETLDPADGTETVTAAIPETLDPGVPGTRMEKSLRDMTVDAIAAQGTVEVPEDGRLRVIGAHERDIIDVIPAGFLVPLLVVLAGGAVISKSRSRDAG